MARDQNFLESHIECYHSTIKLFADDIAIYSEIESQKDCELLQQDLDRIDRWRVKWQLRLQPAKCSQNHSQGSARSIAYVNRVCPILEYGCAVWNPHTEKDKRMLKAVQDRAARWASLS